MRIGVFGRRPGCSLTVAVLFAALPLGAQTPSVVVVAPQTKTGRPPSAAPGTQTPGAQPPAAAAAAPAPAKPAGPNPRDLKFPPLKAVTPPKIETFRLPNGMQLYLMEDHSLPMVYGTALVHTGSLFDPADQIGLGALTGTVIRSGGTAGRTVEELDEQLDNLGAVVDSAISENTGYVSFFALQENLSEVLPIFRDVLTAPQFRQDKLDLAKSQMGGGIARRNDDATALAFREFKSAIYGKDNPYGWHANYPSLARIGQSEVRGFYRRYYFPANVMLAVRGDFAAADMKTRLEAVFSGWHEEQLPPPAFPKFIPKTSGGVYLAEKKDVTQSFFHIGHLGSEIKDPDTAALQVMAAILGGGSQGRLQQKARPSNGIVQVGARWMTEMRHPGLFEIVGTAKPDSTLDAIKAVLEEVDRLQKSEITDEELRTAKESALNSLVFATDTRAKALNRFLSYEYFGFPADFSEQAQKALAAVTKADVQRVAKERIDPSQFTILVVANTVGFVQDLQALGKKVNVIDLSAAQPKIEITRNNEETLAKGKEILARVQKAAGGSDKLAAVKDFTLVHEFQLAAGNRKLTETDRWLAPNFFRQDSEMNTGKVSVYYDGRGGRVTTPQGTFAATAAQLKQIRGDFFRFYVRLLLSDRMEGRTVNATDDHTVEISDTNGDIARLSIDQETALPVSVTYDITVQNGPPTAVLELFSSFRIVDGIQIPERIAIFQRGQKFADVSLVDAQINKGLKPEDLLRVK